MVWLSILDMAKTPLPPVHSFHMATTSGSVSTEVSNLLLVGSQPVFSCSTFSRSGVWRYSRKAAAALG